MNVINFISALSLVVIAFVSLAMIVILSAFNGLEGLVKSLFNSFDPDLKITVVEGKTFITDEEKFKQIKAMEGVALYSEVLEENVLFENDGRQLIGILKGVSDNYAEISGIDTMMVDGEFKLRDKNENFAIIGNGLAYKLSAGVNFLSPIRIWGPKWNAKISILNPENAFNFKDIHPSGIFSIHFEIDEKYIIVPIEFARKLLEYKQEVSAIELKFENSTNARQREQLQQDIQNLLGSNFEIKNRYQQNEFLYKVMQSEKWAIYLIFSFVVLIASFNILASVTMLMLNKKRDIATLFSMGTTQQMVRKIFLYEGWMISLIGAAIGLLLGYLVCWLQHTYGLVQISGAVGMKFKVYPVDMYLADFALVYVIVALVGFFTTWLPVQLITRRYFTDTQNLAVHL